jgi:hypothetical protein
MRSQNEEAQLRSLVLHLRKERQIGRVRLVIETYNGADVEECTWDYIWPSELTISVHSSSNCGTRTTTPESNDQCGVSTSWTEKGGCGHTEGGGGGGGLGVRAEEEVILGG